MSHSRLLSSHLASTAAASILIAALSAGGAGAAYGLETVDDPDAVRAVADLITVDSMPTDDPRAADEPGAVDEPIVVGEPDVSCVVVIWAMPGWVDNWNPTWPQSFVSVHDSDCTSTPIDATLYPVPDVCDTQYQLDKYYVSDQTSALIAGGVLQGYGLEEDLVPGMWGALVHNPACGLPSLANWSASVSLAAETCPRTGGVISQSVVIERPEGSAENPVPVRYYLGYGTSAQAELTETSTQLPTGSYVVTAAVTDPADSVNDGGASIEFPIVIEAQVPQDCDQLEALALTGPADAVVGLGAAAALLVIAGVAGVLCRRPSATTLNV